MSNLPSGYQIRTARIEDLATLADIEQAAAELFRETPYSFLVGAEPFPLDVIKQRFLEGQVWVAVDEGDAPVGFAIVHDVDGTAYLQEIDVHPLHGQKGIGRELVETVCTWAKHHGYHQVLLSTFRNIVWNAPFYAKLGFRILAETEITSGFHQIRHKEAEAGLPIRERVIMERNIKN